MKFFFGNPILWTFFFSSVVQADHFQDLPGQHQSGPVKQLGPGRFQLGGVEINQHTRSLTLPVQINQSTGLVEYLLVHETGKIHESVLRTSVKPLEVHLAFLLLGGQSTGPSSPSGTNIPVWLSLVAREGSTNDSCPAEELILNLQNKFPMTAGPWEYSSMPLTGGKFRPQKEGSIISIIKDPDALVNNPRPGNENDEIWLIHTNRLNRLPTNLVLRIELKPQKNSPFQQPN